MLDDATIAERLQQYLPDRTITNLRPVGEGWETAVYALTAAGGEPAELILRLYPGANVESRAENEAAIIRNLSTSLYPVPRLVAYEPDRTVLGGPFLLIERIDGVPFWERYTHDPVGPDMVRDFTALLFQLHQLDGPTAAAGAAPSTFALDFLPFVLGLGGLEEPFAPLLDWLQQQEHHVGREYRSLIHGDFHRENILVDKTGNPYIIDWSSGALDDARIDLAQTSILFKTQGRPETAEAIRAEYERLLGHPLEHFGYFELVALTRRLAVLMVTMMGGAEAIGMKPGVEAHLKRFLKDYYDWAAHLEQQTGLTLTGIRRVLDQLAEQTAEENRGR